ncbi:hypothetical protein ACFL4U_04185 [Candidatus Neomarinimicrobiota bacterium]
MSDEQEEDIRASLKEREKKIQELVKKLTPDTSVSPPLFRIEGEEISKIEESKTLPQSSAPRRGKVRVAGYGETCVELEEELQEEIIRRTAYGGG